MTLPPPHSRWTNESMAEVLAELPPVANGCVRLYRIQSERQVVLADWIVQAQREDGGAAAAGRWFTHDTAALAFYAQDTDFPSLHILDVTQAQAMESRVDQMGAKAEDGTHPQSFSRDPGHEHFVPREWLKKTQFWKLAAALPTPNRRSRPR